MPARRTAIATIHAMKMHAASRNHLNLRSRPGFPVPLLHLAGYAALRFLACGEINFICHPVGCDKDDDVRQVHQNVLDKAQLV